MKTVTKVYRLVEVLVAEFDTFKEAVHFRRDQGQKADLLGSFIIREEAKSTPKK